jgi:hypothetical protein
MREHPGVGSECVGSSIEKLNIDDSTHSEVPISYIDCSPEQ